VRESECVRVCERELALFCECQVVYRCYHRAYVCVSLSVYCQRLTACVCVRVKYVSAYIHIRNVSIRTKTSRLTPTHPPTHSSTHRPIHTPKLSSAEKRTLLLDSVISWIALHSLPLHTNTHTDAHTHTHTPSHTTHTQPHQYLHTLTNNEQGHRKENTIVRFPFFHP